MAQALVSAVAIGLAGLVATLVLGLRGTDVSRHIAFGIFSTMVMLLAHSMMMFYLIGKGKAVKDAMQEHNVAGDYHQRISAARRPVFSIGILAMAVVHIGHVLRVRDSWVIVLGILATAASFIGLKLGQVGFVLTAIVTAAWSAERKHRPLASGIAIGAAIYAKPFLGLLLLRAIWRRAWTTTVAAVVVALAFVLFGLLVGGWSSYVAWNDRLHNIEWVGYTLNLNGSVTGLLTRTLTSVAPAFHVRPLVVVKSINLWLAVADLCVLAALVWRTREAEIDQSWAAILLGSLLLSPLGWIYYLPIAIGPLVGVWQRATRVTRGWLALGWLLACVPAVPTPFHLGSVGTLLWGSCPTWATLSLFIGALLPPRTQLVEPKPKKDLSMDLHVLYEPTESIA